MIIRTMESVSAGFYSCSGEKNERVSVINHELKVMYKDKKPSLAGYKKINLLSSLASGHKSF